MRADPRWRAATVHPPAIAVTGLRRSYGEHVVLDDIDLEVPEGTVFALLGPNGAGKTTVVNILSTLIHADAGAIRVAGHDLARDPDAIRAAIGVTGQFSAVDELLTGEENLTHGGPAPPRQGCGSRQPDPDHGRPGRRGRSHAAPGLRPHRHGDRVVGRRRPAHADERRGHLAGVALGQVSRNVEAASNLPLPLVLLPFLGSGFVPTDGMPAALRWFAEHQPFTPIMETIRGLLLGSAIGSDGIIAVAWSGGILVVGYLSARRLYDRDPAP